MDRGWWYRFRCHLKPVDSPMAYMKKHKGVAFKRKDEIAGMTLQDQLSLVNEKASV